MASKYREFDRSRLKLLPLSDRHHDLHLDHWLRLDEDPPPFSHPSLRVLAERLISTERKGAARILMMGAHLLRAGVSRHLIDMVERGFIDHIAKNGAGAIHHRATLPALRQALLEQQP